MNEAALLARPPRRRPSITMARSRRRSSASTSGIARARALTDEDRRVVAYHEAGHGARRAGAARRPAACT